MGVEDRDLDEYKDDSEPLLIFTFLQHQVPQDLQQKPIGQYLQAIQSQSKHAFLNSFPPSSLGCCNSDLYTPKQPTGCLPRPYPGSHSRGTYTIKVFS